ncbi:hypothetical protein FOA52_006171 [Chlamydomonas sp. UWO 241]|nr:hypothetical protein FOA52_006171 [Chlamydomonas sp. UWO 241]
MRTRLAELTLEADGIDGRSIYIYGEAWDLGEMVDNQRGVNCGQMNLSGTGLGAFNDRLRDGALGGGPFDPYFYQGLVTGLGLAPNGLNPHRPREDMDDLAKLTDMVRYSLAGNLRSYPLLNSDGVTRTGEDARLHGLPLAYGAFPHEHVAFIGCHDNLTIFDYVSEKSPVTATAEERMRMCVMCMALVALSQGIVFFHAGAR